MRNLSVVGAGADGDGDGQVPSVGTHAVKKKSDTPPTRQITRLAIGDTRAGEVVVGDGRGGRKSVMFTKKTIPPHGGVRQVCPPDDDDC